MTTIGVVFVRHGTRIKLISILPAYRQTVDKGSMHQRSYVLIGALRRLGLAHTRLADATCGTIRLKLLKIGAQVRVSVRRIKVAMASACPYAEEFALAHARICAAAR
ncbi:transposase DDE domain group 1 family protein (plasmid) [Rhizobium leguminosarum bv. viciae]|nr:transposase DDE domain group 1 family protein [Rhizobium leguminosarum bv. viciae]AVC52661.1 transposase DDE domain group 1 family protein [Rhizobium leguminosarum bv. viciae]